MFHILTSVLASIVAAGPGPCRLDLNSSGAIEVVDLSMLLVDWRNPYGPTDLAELLSHWRKGDCPTETGPVRSDNAEGVRRLIFGETAETARIAIIGDSQASMSLGRAYHGMIQWPLDYAVAAMPARMASFAMGPLNLQIPSAATFNSADVDGTFASGVSEAPTQVSEYAMVKDLAVGEQFGAQRFFTQAADWSASWSRFQSATSLRARVVFQDGPGPGNYVGSTALAKHGSAAAGPAVSISAGANDLTGFDVVCPRAPSPGVLDVRFFGDVANENGLVFSHYGGIVGEDAGGGKFVQAPHRPWLMSVVGDGGARWETYADEIAPTKFTWTAYGKFLEQLSGGDPGEAPNLFVVMLGHNFGGFPTTAHTRDAIGRFVSNLRTEYTSRGWPQPHVLCVHAWQVSTVTEAHWRSVWVESYLPNATGRTAVVSIAEFQRYVLHSEHLPDGIHPTDKDDAAFFFGANGLLGALDGAQ